jgi:HlyD family secretion protein
MKRIIWIILGIVVLGGGAYYLLGNKEKPTAYRYETVDRGDVVVSISATGTLSAVTTVTVGSQVSGTIATLHADFNSNVKKGQLLAQLDPTFLAATVQEQRANLDRVKAQRNDALRTHARLKQLFDQSLISQSELDVAVTALESSEASLRQAEASLERAEVNLRYATIRSPIDGVVISRSVDVGQTVAASLSAPVIFTIAQDLTRMQVQASVTEADIGQVTVGLPVTFRVDAYPNDIFKGEVSQVRLAPVIVQNVVTYQVIVGVDNSEMKLMPGMTATITIEVARRTDVLRVPLAAIRFNPPGYNTGGGGRENSAGQGERQMASSDSSKKMDIPDSVRELKRAERRMRRGDSAQGDSQFDSGNRQTQKIAGENSQPKQQPGRLFRMVGDSLTSFRVRTGLAATRYAELISEEFKEGDSVVVGIEGSSSGPSNAANPFAPQMPGGSRSGSRRQGL